MSPKVPADHTCQAAGNTIKTAGNSIKTAYNFGPGSVLASSFGALAENYSPCYYHIVSALSRKIFE